MSLTTHCIGSSKSYRGSIATLIMLYDCYTRFLCYLMCYSTFIRVLVGTGRACFETLRPLAYSLLAELVHHVRSDLSLSQVVPVLRSDVI